MAKAIIDVATMPVEVRRDIGVEARKRIEKDYSIEVVASQYLDLYLSLRPTSPASETGFSA
jgi:glycosyltransferase involved in cell wall biosynthesis